MEGEDFPANSTPMQYENELDVSARDVDDVTKKQNWKQGLGHLLNHLHMTISFLFLFMAFSSVQNLASSLHGKSGLWSLTAIYICFCISSLVLATPIVTFIGTKLSLIIGCICYISFLVANRWPSNIALISTGAILGFGGSILWAAQGTYLTITSSNYSLSKYLPRKASMGLFTGLFFAIFQMCQVIGNLISSFVLSKYGKEIPPAAIEMLMNIYLGVGCAGLLGFLFLRRESNLEKSAEEEKTPTILERLIHAFMVFKKGKMLFLIPTIFYSGIEQSFIFGIFTGEIIKPTLGDGHIGYVMALFGAVDVISSLCMGKISDIFGPFFVVGTGIICHGVVLIGLFVVLKLYPISWFIAHSYCIFIAAVLWGIGDAAFNLYPNTMMSLHFTDEIEPAFSVLKFVQSFASALPFALSAITLTLSFKIECVFAFLVFAVIGLVYLKVFVDLKEKENDNNTLHLQ